MTDHILRNNSECEALGKGLGEGGTILYAGQLGYQEVDQCPEDHINVLDLSASVYFKRGEMLNNNVDFKSLLWIPSSEHVIYLSSMIATASSILSE